MDFSCFQDLNCKIFKRALIYLKSYFHEDVSLDQIYRYMDKLYNKQRELVQQISVEHTRKILGGSIGLMFL